MQRHWLSICILIVVLLIAGCAGSGGSRTVKVAVALPSGIAVGPDMVNAIQLALDEAGGKAGDVTVELLILDNSDPEGSPISNEKEGEVVQQAIDDEMVVAYIGPLASGQAKVSMPLLNEAGITQIAASTTWPGLTKPGYGPGEPGIYYPTGRRHFFRTVPSDEVQGAAAARWAAQLGFETVFVAYETSAYGSGVAGIFRLTAEDIGLLVVGEESYDPDTVSQEEIEALAGRIIEANPDLVYIGGGVGSRAGDFAGACRALDPNIQVMGPDGFALDDLITQLGADAEGMYGTNVAIPADQLESAAAAAFLEKYQEIYGKTPAPYVVATYEAMKVLLKAIEQAQEPTRQGVLDAMHGLGQFSGVFGD